MTAPPREDSILLPSGLRMAYFEWAAAPAQASAPTILLVHATGFHARCWDAVVERLGGRRVIAVDMRGHGRSEKTEPVAWDRFGTDLAEFVDALGLRDAIGVGHSMGGYCVTWAAATVLGAFSRLVLVDPVIFAPEAYAARGQWIEGEEHPTTKRRNRWSGWREMYARFADRLPFSGWEPRVLEDYCRFGIVRDETVDAFVLACPPSVEASVYLGSAGRNIHELLPGVAVPVTILRARPPAGGLDRMDFSSSPTWPRLAECFAEARDVFLPEHSHFIPMEAPALTAEFILGAR